MNVNGQPTRLWRANYAFEALQVPAGTNRVELVYQDRSFSTGVVISLVSLLVGAFLCFQLRKPAPV